MRAAFSVVGLLIVLAIVWLVIKSQFSPQGTTGGRPPVEIIDVAGVKNELLALAQAERMYMASHGSYASIEALQQDGSVTFSGSTFRGYSYTADVDDGQHFKITAAPADASKADWPTMSVDETMQVMQ
jgi:competence protein ComGC